MLALSSCRRPSESASFVIKEKRSEFIASLIQCKAPEEARAALEEIRREHYSATHNCPAWRVGFPNVEEFSSDDGEPAGTAGRPILGAMQKHEIADALLVVTRYFGGVKLGVRGLIDAYTAAAEGVIAAVKLETMLPFRELRLRCGYENFSTLSHTIKSAGVPDFRTKADYASDIALTVFVAPEFEERLRARLDLYEIRRLLSAPPSWAAEATALPAQKGELELR